MGNSNHRNGSTGGVVVGEESIELQQTHTAQNATPAADPETAPNQYPTGSRFILTVLALSLTIFLVALDSSIIAQAIPSITEQFGSIANIAWYGTAYSLSNTSFGLVWGKAYKLFPLKKTYLLAVLIFEVGNVVCAAAQSSNGVVVGRVIAGLGGGGLMNGSFIIMALTVRPERRAMMMAITSTTFGCASVVGPLLGGVLVDALSWRWCFWINIPIGGLAAGIIILFYKQPSLFVPTQGSPISKLIRMDINGGLLVAGSLSMFVLAMHWIGILPSDSSQVIGSLVGSALFAAAFVGNEFVMGDKAVVQSHLLKNRYILRNSLFSFFLAGAFFPLLYLLPIQFQSLGEESAAQSGIRLIPFVLGVSFFTLISNGLLTVWQGYNNVYIFGAICATAGSALMYTFDAQSTTSSWIGSEILASVGIGAALQVPVIANQAVVGLEDVAAATALALFLENVGTSIFVAATDGAFTKGLVRRVQTYLPHVDPAMVVNVGATQLRSRFPPAELQAVLAAYLEGCRDSHLVPVACGSLAGLLSIVSGVPEISTRVKGWISKPHTG